MLALSPVEVIFSYGNDHIEAGRKILCKNPFYGGNIFRAK
jgi:hypothetical protein